MKKRKIKIKNFLRNQPVKYENNLLQIICINIFETRMNWWHLESFTVIDIAQ